MSNKELNLSDKDYKEIEEIGVFAFANKEKEQPLPENDVKILNLMIGNISEITEEMANIEAEATGKVFDFCYKDLFERSPTSCAPMVERDKTFERSISAMPEKHQDIFFSNVFSGLSGRNGFESEYEKKLNSLDNNEKIKLVAALVKNSNDYVDSDRLKKCQKELIKVYKKLSKTYPSIINRPQDKQAALVLVDAMKNQDKHNIFNTDVSDFKVGVHVGDDALDGIKAISRCLFDKKERDFGVGMIAEEDIGGFYCEEANFLAVDAASARFKNNCLHFLTHECTHRYQAKQVDKLKNGEIEKNTPEYFQAAIFKNNLASGYVTIRENSSNLEKLSTIGSYLRQPVEKNAEFVAYAVDSAYNRKTKNVGKKRKIVTGVARVVSDASTNILRLKNIRSKD